MTRTMLGRWAAFLSACVTAAACSHTDDAAHADATLDAASSSAEQPWEILSNRGESYVPNVFYADASENQQVMPYALDGHVMIDRLIYPTLGNPNLYIRSDARDELTIVLRLEDATASNLSFFLVPRSARARGVSAQPIGDPAAGASVYAITPDAITWKEEPADMPAVLKQRHTARVTFRQAAMAAVPPGLYDVRFEQRTPTHTISEYQYNAVSVLETEPDEYNIINVTDTQVAVGSNYSRETRDRLADFVKDVNGSADPLVRDAQFITFNGDLHNGGSPGLLGQQAVATQYTDEAKAIVDLLKDLTKPIFLTAGNHDGFVSTGQVPAAVMAVNYFAGTSLHDVITGSRTPWPNFDIADYERWLASTKASDQLGGAHRDVFTGGFARTASVPGFAGWKPVAERNYVLYDGFHQWQKTYGPLYYSWKFGKSSYVSMNSFELRQHRRAGWGMYTVNYGGGMSDVQMGWLDRELGRAKTSGAEVVLLAHHDPRGGHTGKDRGYYYEQVDYQSIYQSSINYIVGIYWDPQVCKLPGWALSDRQQERCIHDGLQEWMRPDPELDCDWSQRTPDGTCKAGAPLWTSGMELMKRIAASDEVRTMLLGHTHYNELEVLQAGDELLPGQLPIDAAAITRFATLEVTNPFRGFAAQQNNKRLPTNNFVPPEADYDDASLPLAPLEASYAEFATRYATAAGSWSRTLPAATAPAANGHRELVVLRLVSNSDLADQTYSDGKSAMGFSVLDVARRGDLRNMDRPQINRAHFFVNGGSGNFSELTRIEIDRTSRLAGRAAQNPLTRTYSW